MALAWRVVAVAVALAAAEAGVVTRSGGDHPNHLQATSSKHPKAFAPRVFRESSRCPPGQLYVPAIDMCLPANRPKTVAPLESDNLVLELPKLQPKAWARSQLASDCASNEVYNSELSLCLKSSNTQKTLNRAPLPALSLVKEQVKDVPLETSAFASDSQTKEDCKPNEIWLSELSICVEYNSILPPGLQSASLVKDKTAVAKAPLPVAEKPLENARPSSKSACRPNEIYVAEIGLCQPVNPGKAQLPLSSASLVKDPVSSMVGAGPVFEHKRCGPGEIHVSELNICLPSRASKARPAPPPSASLVKEPEALELVSFAYSSSSSDCSPGQFFIVELGICA